MLGIKSVFKKGADREIGALFGVAGIARSVSLFLLVGV